MPFFSRDPSHSSVLPHLSLIVGAHRLLSLSFLQSNTVHPNSKDSVCTGSDSVRSPSDNSKSHRVLYPPLQKQREMKRKDWWPCRLATLLAHPQSKRRGRIKKKGGVEAGWMKERWTKEAWLFKEGKESWSWKLQILGVTCFWGLYTFRKNKIKTLSFFSFFFLFKTLWVKG